MLGKFLRDVAKLNQETRNFRVFGPDETLSNLLGAVFEVTDRQWDARKVNNDEFLAPAGRVLDSMLSEHQCEGWLEGYLLTGRHGLFNSYEAFVGRGVVAGARPPLYSMGGMAFGSWFAGALYDRFGFYARPSPPAPC